MHACVHLCGHAYVWCLSVHVCVRMHASVHPRAACSVSACQRVSVSACQRVSDSTAG